MEEEDNVFICSDTQVILRINSRDGVINSGGIGETNEESLVKGRSGKSKIYSKRMTKRLITATTTTVPQVITEVLLSIFFELVKRSSINDVTLRQ